MRKASIHRMGAACAALVAIALCICGAKRQGQASARSRESEMSEADILSTAHARIERYRKSDAVVRVVDGAGAPVAGARVKIEQIRQAFLFGCNAFPVLGYDDPKLEQAYEEQFAALFNYATLGFYWGAYERGPGQTQEKRLRRQAEWCKAHGIATKGHPLVWHEVYPSWGPSEVRETKEKLRARVTDIVSGFKGLVDRWDVVNEATVSAEHDNGVGHWAKQEGAFAMVAEALGWARAANPKAVLLYNDFKLDEDYEKLAAELTSGSKTLVDTFGIQSHMHREEWPISKVWEACETYSRFGKPLHFTEVTVLSGEHGWGLPQPWPSTPDGEAKQAAYVEKLYTVLFSHPAVQAITWWDFNDGAWQGAPAGLVHKDLTPKPAYQRLLALVRGRWWTSLEAQSDAEGAVEFRGFKGRYRVTVTTAAGTATEEMDVAEGAKSGVTVTAK
jgi:GH35 family endo-1,4-beta-xylanase